MTEAGSNVHRFDGGRFQFAERHDIRVRASPNAVFDAVLNIDLSRSRVVRALCRLRGISASSFTMEGMRQFGFVELARRPPEGIAFGLIGKFWTPAGNLQHFAPEDFAACEPPGFAKVLWEFTLSPAAGETRLETVTRIRCTDRRSRTLFRAYWLAVRPFSGWIRREALRLIRDDAERSAAQNAALDA